MSPPSGVVTFLFTDIEGSTRRWETDADAMRAALAAHDDVLHTAIEAHDGFLFKHTGDGVIAAFASPSSAVDAAVAAQRALALPVRMGLATGEAQLRGEDYFGVVLNRAARVMAAGHGGQVLVADSTAVLLRGVDLVDLGPRRLRDLPTPLGVFQVLAPGLQTDFPTLKALDTGPGNLRAASTSFIGRETDVDEVAAAVGAHRLVTLTGAGGVGKTRLAVEVAAGLADEFPDGVWLFELAAVTDPAAMPVAVATVLGITQQPGKNMSESVATALEGRVRLLIIDNCEHLLDAAAELTEAILAHSATVKILATSREGLGVADEQLWPVPSLDLGAGIDSAAVHLFVERARSVAPRFSVAEPDEAGAVVDICRRLDGIPLAIELAASRVASMTTSEIRNRLDQRFRLLVGSRRGQERHHALRHTVQWSYDLLADAEKRLLECCSVFAGGFEIESACAIARSSFGDQDLDDYAVLNLLDALVRKSLLSADRSSKRTRFAMLETIRQFADEQLGSRGMVDEVRTAHSRHFAEREADVLALWDSPQQREAYTWFDVELPNLRAAFRWAAEHGDLDVAVALTTNATFLGVGIDKYEPNAWAEELIEPARAVNHPRLLALYVMASQCWMVGRFDEAVRYSDAGQLVAGSGGGVAFGSEGLLGASYQAIGRSDRTAEWCRARLACGRDTHGITRTFLVINLAVAGAAEEARIAADGLVDAVEENHNPYALSLALLATGFAFRDADPMRALGAVRRGLAIARESGNRANESFLAGNLSLLEAEYGDLQAALDCLTLAIRNYHDSGQNTLVRTPLAVLAALFDRLGHYEPAATIAGFAVDSLSATAYPEITIAIAHLRDVLGHPVYESFARAGEMLNNAEIATYALDRIDQARAEVSAS